MASFNSLTSLSNNNPEDEVISKILFTISAILAEELSSSFKIPSSMTASVPLII
jgi:hypothetical protein